MLLEEVLHHLIQFIILFEKDDVFGGRLKRGYLGNQPVDLGAVRIPTDFTLTPKLVKELGLTLIPFTTALKGTFTREKWFPIEKLNESQERYFLPSNTPSEEKQEVLFLMNQLIKWYGL